MSDFALRPRAIEDAFTGTTLVRTVPRGAYVMLNVHAGTQALGRTEALHHLATFAGAMLETWPDAGAQIATVLKAVSDHAGSQTSGARP